MSLEVVYGRATRRVVRSKRLHWTQVWLSSGAFEGLEMGWPAADGFAKERWLTWQPVLWELSAIRERDCFHGPDWGTCTRELLWDRSWFCSQRLHRISVDTMAIFLGHVEGIIQSTPSPPSRELWARFPQQLGPKDSQKHTLRKQVSVKYLLGSDIMKPAYSNTRQARIFTHFLPPFLPFLWFWVGVGGWRERNLLAGWWKKMRTPSLSFSSSTNLTLGRRHDLTWNQIWSKNHCMTRLSNIWIQTLVV